MRVLFFSILLAICANGEEPHFTHAPIESAEMLDFFDIHAFKCRVLSEAPFERVTARLTFSRRDADGKLQQIDTLVKDTATQPLTSTTITVLITADKAFLVAGDLSFQKRTSALKTISAGAKSGVWRNDLSADALCKGPLTIFTAYSSDAPSSAPIGVIQLTVTIDK
jgi:hypothetical protein